MSSTSSSAHASDAVAGPHGAGDHGEGHGHDDHAHGAEVLGPLDPMAWGAGVLGILGGLVVALCLAVAAGWLG
ncbi:MAG: hypothetical protein HY264_06280 [Chloroflexi bacterium]|nr:hypothetical protein [Chloroflexota bacterium]